MIPCCHHSFCLPDGLQHPAQLGMTRLRDNPIQKPQTTKHMPKFINILGGNGTVGCKLNDNAGAVGRTGRTDHTHANNLKR